MRNTLDRMKKVVVSALALGTFLAPMSVQGRSVTFPMEFYGLTETPNGQQFGWFGGPGSVGQNRVNTDISGSFEKTINLKMQDGLNASVNEVIEIGETLDLLESNTKGSWYMSGGIWDTPPMDGSLHNVLINDPRPNALQQSVINVGFTQPSDMSDAVITSSNPNVIECDGSGCQAKSSGSSIVTITFSNDYEASSVTTYHGRFNRPLYSTINQFNAAYPDLENGYADQSPPFVAMPNRINGGFLQQLGQTYDLFLEDISDQSGSAQGYGYTRAINMASRGVIAKNQIGFLMMGYNALAPNAEVLYKFEPITYNITVVEGDNQPPSVSYDSTTSITDSSARLNWNYSDPENDPQTRYQVRVYSDSARTNLVYNQALTGSGENHQVTGLEPATTYYPQVRVRNALHDWTNWATGASFETTSDTNPPSTDGFNEDQDNNDNGTSDSIGTEEDSVGENEEGEEIGVELSLITNVNPPRVDFNQPETQITATATSQATEHTYELILPEGFELKGNDQSTQKIQAVEDNTSSVIWDIRVNTETPPLVGSHYIDVKVTDSSGREEESTVRVTYFGRRIFREVSS